MVTCLKYTHYDGVIKWKHFPCYWPFVRGIHRSPVDSLRKGQWRAALKLSLICAWTNGWANIRDADDFRYHRDHYDVAVKLKIFHCLPMAAGRDGICSLASVKTALVFETLQDVLLTHFPPSAVNMRQWNGSALVQIMARHQAITRTNADLLSIGPLGTNFSEIRIKLQSVSFMKWINVVSETMSILFRTFELK